LLVVLVVMGVLLGLSIPRLAMAADQAAVRAATADAAAVFRTARSEAIYRRAAVAVVIDTLRGSVVARADTVLLVRRELGRGYSVRLAATRDSMAFDAHGLGVGAANLSLVARRGRFADTLFVSRLGRLRY
jgi:type II secretory pathway pseudopilin PulG